MVLNHQKSVALNLPGLRTYVRRLGGVLRLGRRDFNVCFVDDNEIERLNTVYRGKRRPTDVLSFPWQSAGEVSVLAPAAGGRPSRSKPAEGALDGHRNGEFKNFLGDVVISAETARRNARSEGHSTQTEIRWLILHGVLHLLGCDHATDDGEMTALELSIRAKLS